jgi:hypothetical protein
MGAERLPDAEQASETYSRLALTRTSRNTPSTCAHASQEADYLPAIQTKAGE